MVSEMGSTINACAHELLSLIAQLVVVGFACKNQPHATPRKADFDRARQPHGWLLLVRGVMPGGECGGECHRLKWPARAGPCKGHCSCAADWWGPCSCSVPVTRVLHTLSHTLPQLRSWRQHSPPCHQHTHRTNVASGRCVLSAAAGPGAPSPGSSITGQLPSPPAASQPALLLLLPPPRRRRPRRPPVALGWRCMLCSPAAAPPCSAAST